MKKHNLFSRFAVLLMVICLITSMAITSNAAEVASATIDMDADCSITIYKYDLTNAEKDGVYTGSYVSTGVADKDFEKLMGEAVRKGDTDKVTDHHSGTKANGYALAGVEFTYLKVADFIQTIESGSVKVLYGFDKVKAADLLSAIGLENGKSRCESVDTASTWYYESNILSVALAKALANDATATKNALEAYIAANKGNDTSVGGVMPLTNENGYTKAEGLKPGLYIVVETKASEAVICTTAPFFLSLPMTSVNGTNATDGGHRWIYDVTLYPKNQTGIVSLEKMVKESGTDNAFSHNATGSAGDVMEYAITSTLPYIDSTATYLTEYTFHDVLDVGLSYTKGDVVIELFTDKECATTAIAKWTENDTSAKFTVSFDGNEMYIRMTAAGLAEINGNYANHTMKISYTAKINSDNTVVYGDGGNDNTVSLTWRRTSAEYYDMLWDDCHVYTYALDLTKLFKERTMEEDVVLIDPEQATADGLYDQVVFKIRNTTDGYYLVAQLNEAEGVYYVTGQTAVEAEATTFSPKTIYPNTENTGYGRIVVKGLENDTYEITELETANGYALMKDSTVFTINVQEDAAHPCTVYQNEAKLGVYQNDGRYYFDGAGPDLPLSNMPQKQLAHVRLTASGVVSGVEMPMLNDADSVNAIIPVKIDNMRGFNLPESGELANLILTTVGTFTVLGCVFFLFVYRRKKAAEN